MPAMNFGKGAYRRLQGDVPEVRLVNLYAEMTPTTDGGISLQCRRGLESFATRGAGPINGLYAQKGVFGESLFAVSGSTLYMDAANLGSVSGSGPVSWASSGTELLVARGGAPKSYNGSNLSTVSVPDASNIVAVEYLAGLFFYVVTNSNKFFWSEVLNGRIIDALDFANAELAPDILVDVKAILGRIYFIGTETIEPWFPSGNAELPVTRQDQGLIGKGAWGTGCTQVLGDTLVFVGSDAIVYQLAGGLKALSDEGLAERIKASATVSTYTYDDHGAEFFAIRLDTGTFACNMKTSEWNELATYGRDNFRAQTAANKGEAVYFGDDENGTVWTFGDVFHDGDDDLEAYFTGMVGVTGGTLTIDSIEVRGNVGQTDPLAGDDANPVVEMRLSRNAGNTFEAWREASFGGQGKFRTRARFRRCGMFDPPGAYAEFRLTDQSPRRISGVFYNEPGGGRGR